MRVGRSVAVAAAAMAVLAPPPAQAQDADAFCDGGTPLKFTRDVPLDHDHPTDATITARADVCRASGKRRGTIVVLPGGPGERATVDEEPLGSLNDHYDLVFFTPRAARLRCKALERKSLDEEDLPAAVGRCAGQLGDARAFYTTYQTVRDLELVRQGLGLGKIIPLGISYGTKIAGEYARRFPQSVQAVVLDSAVPIEFLDMTDALPPLALERVLREVCFPPGCRRAFGRSELGLVRAALARQRRIGRFLLYDLLKASDADPLVRAELPATLDAAARGDLAPLFRLLRHTGGLSGGGLGDAAAGFLATSCVEGQLPWDPAGTDSAERRRQLLVAAIAQRRGLFPTGIVLQESGAVLCLGWPATPPPPFPPSPGSGPDVPVLVLAGREDLRTPLENQRRVASQYPDAQVFAVPRVGHSVLGSDATGCAIAALHRFLAKRPLGRCPRTERDVELALRTYRTLGSVPRASGDAPAKVARTATAVDLTLRDASRWALSKPRGRVRGLRGGRLVIGRRTVTLVDYQFVRGVRVSGTLTRARRATFTVGGTGATGTLTLVRGRTSVALRGVLDGVRVRYRPKLLPPG